MFNNLTNYLDRCLEEMDRKAASGGLDESDLHYGDLIAHFAKSLDTHVAMQEQGGYSGRNYRDGDMSRDSSRRNDGSSYGGTWPMMGTMPTRPMSRGYSRADRMDELVQVIIPVAIGVEHQAVVECGGREVLQILAYRRAVVTANAATALRVLPVVHHLGHCRGYAAHGRV